MAFNIISIEDEQIYHDTKKIVLFKNLKRDLIMLSPDKGNGIVLLEKQDYNQSMQDLFSNRTKFRLLPEDPTNLRL